MSTLTKGSKITKPIVVLYHAGCTDGFSSAWAAWKKLGNTANYIGIGHDLPPSPDLKGKTIYMIDIVYRKDDLLLLMKRNKAVIVLDHHVSMRKTVELATVHRYALNRSGATLAWLYFHGKKPIPKLLRHVEDMDLWRFKVPHTLEISAALGLYDFDLKIWDRIAYDLENKKKYARYVAMGKTLLNYEDQLIKRLVLNNAQLVKFMGVKAYAVNSPNFHSELGHRLAKRLPPMGIVWSERSGRIKISLRSEGDFDVSKLATRFGNGGGHKHAAGFSLPAGARLPWKRIEK